MAPGAHVTETAADTAERILVAAITDPGARPHEPAPTVLDAIRTHTLAPLAWDTLVSAGHRDAWPASLRSTLRAAAAAHVLVSELVNAELRRVIASLGDAGLRAALVKGAAIAHTHYRYPHWRPRGDSDLVIRAADRDAIAGTLSALGYERSGAIDGDLLTQQSQWRRPLGGAVLHTVDVHWRVFNPHVLATVLPVERLLARAVPVRALGTHAMCACPVDALLLACVHRVAHHAEDDENLIWAYDIHLLTSSLDAREAPEFAQTAAASAVRALCAHGIAVARARFGTPVPSAVEDVLAVPAAGEASRILDRKSVV